MVYCEITENVLLPFQRKGTLVIPLVTYLGARLEAQKNLLDMRRTSPQSKVNIFTLWQTEKSKLVQQFGFEDGE